MKVDGPDISKYGVAKMDLDNEQIIGIIEKPSFENAPSNLASIGRYVLDPVIFEILKRQNRELLVESCINFLPIRVELDLRGWENDIFSHSS